MKGIAAFILNLWFSFLDRYEFLMWLVCAVGVLRLFTDSDYLVGLHLVRPGIAFYVLAWYPILAALAGMVAAVTGNVDVRTYSYHSGGGYLASTTYRVGRESRRGRTAKLTGIGLLVVALFAIAVLGDIVHYAYPSIAVYGVDGVALPRHASASVLSGTDFGSVAVGSSGKRVSLVISNPGEGALIVRKILAGEDFRVESQFPLSIGPGASAPFSVAFIPQKVGEQQSALLFDTNIKIESGKASPVLDLRGLGQ
jgi:hypothetical protein